MSQRRPQALIVRSVQLITVLSAVGLGCEETTVVPVHSVDGGYSVNPDAGERESPDAGSVDSDAGSADGDLNDAGSPDAGDCVATGDLPAPDWVEMFPFDADGAVLPAGLIFDPAVAVDGLRGALVSGFSGHLARPELSPPEAFATTTSSLIDSFDVDTGASVAMSTLRAGAMFLDGVPRPRADAVASKAFVGQLVLPNGVMLQPGAPVFTPLGVLVHADGTIREPIIELLLSAQGMPPGIDAAGAAGLTVSPAGETIGFATYIGASATLRVLATSGAVVQDHSLPDAAQHPKSALFALHADGRLGRIHTIDADTSTAPLATAHSLVAVVAADDGEIVIDGSSFPVSPAAARAIVVFDPNFHITAIRPIIGDAHLLDLVDVDDSAFCSIAVGASALFEGIDEPVATGAFTAGTSGASVVCFNAVGLSSGAARIEQGATGATQLGQRPLSAHLDRLGDSVAFSGGFRGALHIDDGRGGVADFVDGAGNIDGALARFDRAARLVDAHHIENDGDVEILGAARVGDGVIMVGSFRGCLAFRGPNGTIARVFQRAPMIDGGDGFLARFSGVFAPNQ